MLVYGTKLLNTRVLSVQTGSTIGNVSRIIVNPDNLQIIALEISGPLVSPDAYILDIASIREYSAYGIVIDSIDELVASDDIIKISEILALNFNLVNLKAETKKGSKLGRIMDYTFTSEDFMIQQLIVKRPAIKSLLDPELTISRKEIVEVNDYKVIIEDEIKTIKEKSTKEEFVPNFVNPFREQGFAPVDTKNPDAQDN